MWLMKFTTVFENLYLNGPFSIFLPQLANILKKSSIIIILQVKNWKFSTGYILVANGAFESLFSMGFEEDTDALFLPMSASIEVVQAFKTAIERLTPPSDATLATEGKVHIF